MVDILGLTHSNTRRLMKAMPTVLLPRIRVWMPLAWRSFCSLSRSAASAFLRARITEASATMMPSSATTAPAAEKTMFLLMT